MGEPRLSVLKVGGSVLEGPGSYLAVAEHVRRGFLERGSKPIVVVSAMKGVTDTLLRALGGDQEALAEVLRRYSEAARELGSTSLVRKVGEELEELSRVLRDPGAAGPEVRDLVMSYGERLSKYLMVEALEVVGASAYALDARELVVTDDVHGDATVDYGATRRRLEMVYPVLAEKAAVPVIEGFVGRSRSGRVTTLGRGGSDYTATTIASLLAIEEVYLVTSVDGILTADPGLVPSARVVPAMDYEEAAEASHHGVKGINPKTFEPLGRFHCPRVFVGSLRRFGTMIVKQLPGESRERPKVLAYKRPGAHPYVAIVGRCASSAKFLAGALRLLEEEGVELVGLEVRVGRPSVVLYLGGELDPGSLARLHERLFEGVGAG